eukprot:905929-Amphidinium_carterae.1
MALRAATNDDALGIEAVNAHLPELRDIQRRTRRIRDLTNEFLGPAEEGTTRRRRMSSASASTVAPRSESASEAVGSDSTSLSRLASAAIPDEPVREVRRRLEPLVASRVANIEGATPVSDRPSEQPSASSGDQGPAVPEPESAMEVTTEREFIVWQEHDNGVGASDMETVRVSDTRVCAAFDSKQACFMVSKLNGNGSKKLGEGEVSFDNIPQEHRAGFDEAISKEIRAMIETNGALQPVSVQESNWVREHLPQRIIPSRMLLRLKPVDDADGIHRVPKARWVLIGFKDPDVLSLSGESPTPQLQTINVALQLASSFGWCLFQGDVREAFLQSDTTQRTLYVTQPETGVPGMQSSQLLKLVKEVYGSVAAPASWRKRFTRGITDLGYHMSVTDPCVFLLHEPEIGASIVRGTHAVNIKCDAGEMLFPALVTEPSSIASEPQSPVQFKAVAGFIVVLVDDVLEAGNPLHREKMIQLQSVFRFGKHLNLQTKGGGVYNGRRILQRPDGEIHVHMGDYIREKLSEIQIQRARKKDPDALLVEDERSLLHTVLMKLQWVARQCRPEIQ